MEKSRNKYLKRILIYLFIVVIFTVSDVWYYDLDWKNIEYDYPTAAPTSIKNAFLKNLLWFGITVTLIEIFKASKEQGNNEGELDETK